MTVITAGTAVRGVSIIAKVPATNQKTGGKHLRRMQEHDRD